MFPKLKLNCAHAVVALRRSSKSLRRLLVENIVLLGSGLRVGWMTKAFAL
jgi:hypothetical protein